MRLHASLLVTVCCALSFPFVPAEPSFNRNEPIVDRFPTTHDAVAWNSGPIVTRISSHEATLETVAVTTLSVPRVDPVRTSAQLTVPAGAQWQTTMVHESLILTLESGELRVSLKDGEARIARDAETNLGGSTLDVITPDREAIMRAGDRLVAHGDGKLTVQSDGAYTTASIIRVGLPATP